MSEITQSEKSKKEQKRESNDVQIDSFIVKNDPISKNDLLYFKNDILKDIKDTISKLNQKNETKNLVNKDDFAIIEKRLTKLEEKFPHLIEEKVVQYMINEKVSKLEANMSKFREKMMSLEIEIGNITKKIGEMTYKYDKLIEEEILNPRIIGPKNKFRNFRELTDFLLTNITKVGHDLELEKVDIQVFKEKMDNRLQFMESKGISDINLMKEFAINCTNNRIMTISSQIDNIDKEHNSNNIALKIKMSSIEQSMNDIIMKMEQNKSIIEANQKVLENKFNDHLEKYLSTTKDISGINNNLELLAKNRNDSYEKKDNTISSNEINQKYFYLLEEMNKFKTSIFYILKKHIPNLKYRYEFCLPSDKQIKNIEHLAKFKFKPKKYFDNNNEKVPTLVPKSKSVQKKKFDFINDEISNIKLNKINIELSNDIFDNEKSIKDIIKKDKEIRGIPGIEHKDIPTTFIKKIDHILKNHNANYELNKSLTARLNEYNSHTNVTNKKNKYTVLKPEKGRRLFPSTAKNREENIDNSKIYYDDIKNDEQNNNTFNNIALKKKLNKKLWFNDISNSENIHSILEKRYLKVDK